MAFPIITANSPVAGSISWTATGIIWDGVEYNILPGSTAKKWVVYRWNNGSPYLQELDDINTDDPANVNYIQAPDAIIFANKGGVGHLVPTTDVKDGSLLVTGSISARHLGVDSVTSNAILSNAIQSEHIEAGAITTSKLSVGTVSDNLVANGSFEDYIGGSTIEGWAVIAASNGSIAVMDATVDGNVTSSGRRSVKFSPTTTTANLRLRQHPDFFIPVSAASGRRYYLSARMGVAGTATTTGSYVRANWFDANKVQLTTGGTSDIRGNAALTTTFTLYEGQLIPPAAARYLGVEILHVNPNITSNVYVDEVTVHEVTMAAQIGDGQITASKVGAKQITADKLVISDSTNYINDWRFDYNGVGWSLGTTTTGGVVATISDPPVAGTGTKALQMTGTSQVKDVTHDAFPVAEGDWYWASCYVRATVATTSAGTVQLGATINRTTGGPTWPSFETRVSNTLTNAWTKLEGFVEIPANATTFQLRPSVRNDVTSGTFQFRDFILRRMNGGELIVDGAITTEKLLANAIDGMVITGATIQTAKTGARLVINETSLKGWDANNLNYLTADANGVSVTGTVSATGVSKDWVTNANVNIKATLGNKTARNTWVGYDFQQPGVYFEKDGITQNAISMPRLVAKYTDTMSAESAHAPVNAAGDLNVINQSSFTAAPYGASLGSKKYDKRINEDGGAGVNGVLSSASIISEPDGIVARAEDGADTYYGSWLMALGATGMDGSSSYPGITQGAELGFRPGGNDPNQSKAYLKMDRPGVGGAYFDLYSSSGADVNRIRSEGNTLNIDSSNVNINGARMLPLQHAEFTSTATPPHATLWGPGSMTRDNNRSASGMFVQHYAPDCFRVTEAGVYNIAIIIDTGTSNVTNTQCIIRRVSDNGLIFGGAKAAGAWEFNVSSPVYLLAGEEFRFRYYHEAGGTQTWNARVRITKTSAMSAPASLPGTSHSLTGDLTVGGTAYLKQIVNQSHWTAEWTAGSTPAATLWGPGQPAPVLSRTSDPTLISWPANDTLQFRDAGIYSLSAQVRQNTGVSQGSGTQSFVSFEPTSAGPPAFAKGFMGPNENQCSASIANIYVGAGQQMKCYLALHTAGGGSSTVNWRINVTRIG